MADSMAGPDTIPPHLWGTQRAARELGVYGHELVRLIQRGRRGTADRSGARGLVKGIETQLAMLSVQVQELRVGLARGQRRSSRRAAIPPTVRFAVLERDGWQCRYCGRRPPEVALALDHVIPASKGGPDTIENLLTACVDCNQGKRDRDVDPASIPG
jgi:hypothetical protein